MSKKTTTPAKAKAAATKKTVKAPATKKAATTNKAKAATKKAAAAKKPEGIIQQIIALFKKGKTQRQIIDLGYASGTVYRQVLIYKQANKIK